MQRTLPFLFFLVVSFAFADRSQLPDPEKKWAKEIAKFDVADGKQAPPKDAVLFAGSSSIRMWKLDVSWPGRTTINRGFGGSTFTDLIHFFDRIVLPYEPTAIVIYEGDNDIAKGLTAEEVIADYRKFVGLVEENLPGIPVIFVAIKPSIKRWDMWPTMKAANDGIAEICAGNENLFFADIAKPMLDNEKGEPRRDWFADDGLHLNAEGYVGWKAVVEPLLAEALKE